MDQKEWEKRKAEIEKLDPPLRIEKYFEILKLVDKDSEIFNEIISLIEKASMEETIMIEKQHQTLELEEAIEEKSSESSSLEEKVPNLLISKNKEAEISQYSPSKSPQYKSKKTNSMDNEKYFSFENIEIKEPKFRTEEDFYKTEDLIKNKRKPQNTQTY